MTDLCRDQRGISDKGRMTVFYFLADCFLGIWIGSCNHLSVREAQERNSSDCPFKLKYAKHSCT